MYQDNSRQSTSTGRRGYVGVDRRWLSESSGLKASPLRLMMWLDSHSDEYLSALDLTRCAREIGWGRGRVRDALASLVDLGLISTEIIHHPTSQRRTLITLHLDVWSGQAVVSKSSGTVVSKSSGPSHDYRPDPSHENRPTSISTYIDRNELLEPPTPSGQMAIEAVSAMKIVASSFDDDFELFWKTYGQVGSKKKARECWERAIRKAAPEVIQAGLERWTEYWMSPDSAKQKWPQGWLSEERWNDAPPFASVKSDAPKLTNSTAALKQAMQNRMNQ